MKAKNTKKVKVIQEGNLEIQDGQVKNIRSIDELWGISTKNYKQKDMTEYEDYLKSLDNSDADNLSFELRQEAARFKIPATFTKRMVLDELKKLFRADYRRRNQTTENIQQQVISPELNKKLIELINS